MNNIIMVFKMLKKSGMFSHLSSYCDLFVSYAPDSEMNAIIQEGLNLLEFKPDILAKIKTDQDRHGINKKIARIKDATYLNRTNDSLFDDREELEEVKIDSSKVVLEQGCKRMPEIAVFIFMILRGYLSSLSNRFSRNFLTESITIHSFLQFLSYKMPGKSTINDNLNCISEETRKYIMQAQLEMILNGGLDDFEKCYIDSTAVKGSSCWPTDAGIIRSLLLRTSINSQKLNKHFKLNNFRENSKMEKNLKKLKSLLFEINMTSGKANSKKKIKENYKTYLKIAKKVHDYQIKEFDRLEPEILEADLIPTKREQLNQLWMKIEDDLASVVYVIYYAGERIFDDVVLKSTEKILSISEKSVAFIKKGGRLPVIGYKPQLATSEKGFITSLLVEEGNASDSSQLVPVFEDVVKNTGITPKVVSTDDGYSSLIGRNKLLKYGVEVVSINGGKGRRLTSDEDWNSKEYQDARNKRSRIESSIFTIKYLFEFNAVRRRGIKSVTSEMLEKIITFNFYRITWLKDQEKRKRRKAAA